MPDWMLAGVRGVAKKENIFSPLSPPFLLFSIFFFADNTEKRR